MPWFVIQSERKTWTKYIVEAADEAAALESTDKWRYLGYLDGEDTDSKVIGRNFSSASGADNDAVSYVAG